MDERRTAGSGAEATDTSGGSAVSVRVCERRPNPHYTGHDGMRSGNRKAGAGRSAKRKAIRRISLEEALAIRRRDKQKRREHVKKKPRG
jgi:hypothetical protein